MKSVIESTKTSSNIIIVNEITDELLDEVISQAKLQSEDGTRPKKKINKKSFAYRKQQAEIKKKKNITQKFF